MLHPGKFGRSAMIPFIFRLLFDPRGRAGRTELLLGASVMLGLEMVCLMLWAQFGESVSSLVVVIKAVEILIGVSATIKRLHDTGHTGWWVLGGAAILCMWTAVVALGGIMLVGRDVLIAGSIGHLVILGLVMLPALGMTLWLHLAEGVVYKNKYGVPPNSLFAKPFFASERTESSFAAAATNEGPKG
jgi:uncharacterized membrane protein YhaH (DUF805 family)